MENEELNELAALALKEITGIMASDYQANPNFRIREIRTILTFVPDIERQIWTARRRLIKHIERHNPQD